MSETSADVSAIYQRRFIDSGLERRDAVWKVLCQTYFNKLFDPRGSVLDMACGYGEFINNVSARDKYAVDLNTDAAKYLNPDIKFTVSRADDLSHIPSNTLDRVFTSNFLEHLPNKSACDSVLVEVLRVLKPGGRFIILGPNIRYAYKEYWDFYDHYLPLSHLSLAEGLRMNGYEVKNVIDRFLPYTMANKRPTHPFLIKSYLRLPLAWKILGKQFLVTAAKPEKAAA